MASKNWRQYGQGLIVGGLIGAALAGVPVGVWSFAGAFDGGALLGYFGAMIGTGFAVTGALFVENQKRRGERRQTADLLNTALASLYEITRLLADNIFVSPTKRPVRSLLQAYLFTLRDVGKSVAFARTHGPLESITLFNSLEGVIAWLARFEKLRERLSSLSDSDQEELAEIARDVEATVPLLQGSILDARRGLTSFL